MPENLNDTTNPNPVNPTDPQAVQPNAGNPAAPMPAPGANPAPTTLPPATDPATGAVPNMGNPAVDTTMDPNSGVSGVDNAGIPTDVAAVNTDMAAVNSEPNLNPTQQVPAQDATVDLTNNSDFGSNEMANPFGTNSNNNATTDAAMANAETTEATAPQTPPVMPNEVGSNVEILNETDVNETSVAPDAAPNTEVVGANNDMMAGNVGLAGQQAPANPQPENELGMMTEVPQPSDNLMDAAATPAPAETDVEPGMQAPDPQSGGNTGESLPPIDNANATNMMNDAANMAAPVAPEIPVQPQPEMQVQQQPDMMQPETQPAPDMSMQQPQQPDTSMAAMPPMPETQVPPAPQPEMPATEGGPMPLPDNTVANQELSQPPQMEAPPAPAEIPSQSAVQNQAVPAQQDKKPASSGGLSGNRLLYVIIFILLIIVIVLTTVVLTSLTG